MGCHFLVQGNLPDPGIEARSLALQADSLPTELPGNSHKYSYTSQILTKVVLVVQDAGQLRKVFLERVLIYSNFPSLWETYLAWLLRGAERMVPGGRKSWIRAGMNGWEKQVGW